MLPSATGVRMKLALEAANARIGRPTKIRQTDAFALAFRIRKHTSVRGRRCREMTPRQQRFVDEYLLDLNATQAAIRAGYSARTANEQGTRLG